MASHFSLVFQLLLVCLQKPFLLSFMSLARCSTRQALAFMTLFLHAWIVSLGLLSCFHLSCLLLMSEFVKNPLFICTHFLTTLAWLSAHQDRPFLSLEEVILENQPAVVDPILSRTVSHGLLAHPWTEQSLLSWGPGLWSCYLSCSCLMQCWIPPSHDHCSQDCSNFHMASSYFFVSLKSNRACSPIGSWITDVGKLVLGCSRDLLDCLCCTAFWAVTRMVEVFHEDSSLQMWGFFQMPEKGLMFYFLLTGRSVADAHHSAARIGLHTNTDP